MNSDSIHSLYRTTPNPLSCPGLTPYISSNFCAEATSGRASTTDSHSSVTEKEYLRIDLPSPLFDNILSYGDCLEVKREYDQNCFTVG